MTIEHDDRTPHGEAEVRATRSLYRAVGLNEARDIEAVSGFRLDPASGYQDGKWFAARFDDAVHWGRAIQRFPQPRPFRIAVARIPGTIAAMFEQGNRI